MASTNNSIPQTNRTNLSGHSLSSMNGFRIAGYPAAAGSVVGSTRTERINPTTTIGTTTTTLTTAANSIEKINKINNTVSMCGYYNGDKQQQQQKQGNSCLLVNQQQRQLQQQQQQNNKQNLNIKEQIPYPSPPPQLTTMPPTNATTTITPIALKGNNPFLNSPSPTETTMFSSVEIPDYAEPQQYQRVNKPNTTTTTTTTTPITDKFEKKQIRPHSIAVDCDTSKTSSSFTTPAFSSIKTASSATFFDYNVSQQQQRLIQLTQQQQKLRNAVDVATSVAQTQNNESGKETLCAADKESLYAAIFKQYRNSPTCVTHAPIVGRLTPTTAADSNLSSTVQFSRNQQSPSLNQQNPIQQQQQQQQPIVPRRSQSTPRPLKSTITSQMNGGISSGIVGGDSGNVTVNGNRPRSLDRFNSENRTVYQAPPVPLRRFVQNVSRNVHSPQPEVSGSELNKFVGTKSTSIDNIRLGLSGLNVTGNGNNVPKDENSVNAGIRHSVTFHGRQSDGQLNIEEEKPGSSTWQKNERPISFAFGSEPDQSYLENQLRAYSEQLRTITESVRKYSEQAKLLSELKRQQHLAKQQQQLPLGNGYNNKSSGTATSSQNLLNTPTSETFSSSMISPEIVGKSLASLSNCNEAQTPSSQLRLFLDNIRSTMRTEYQQHIPDEILQPIDKLKSTQLHDKQQQQHQQQLEQKRQQVKSVSQDCNNENFTVPQKGKMQQTPLVPTRSKDLPTPSDQLRLFLDAIRANKLPENYEKSKMVNSKTLDSFITKSLQMPDVTSGTPETDYLNISGSDTIARRRPKSSISLSGSTKSGSSKDKLDKREHSMITSESFHQISDNLKLMSEDLKALSPSRVVSSHSNGNIKQSYSTTNSLTTELRVITSTSPLAGYPLSSNDGNVGLLGTSMRSTFDTSSTSLAPSLSSTTSTTTPSTTPLTTDFNEILDSFQKMAEKYKSKGSYEYLRKCSEALRQHSQQLRLHQEQQKQHIDVLSNNDDSS